MMRSGSLPSCSTFITVSDGLAQNPLPVMGVTPSFSTGSGKPVKESKP
jgi:hypothetical protein